MEPAVKHCGAQESEIGQLLFCSQQTFAVSDEDFRGANA